MSTIFVPAQPYPKQANDNIRSSDWNAAINEVSRLSDTTQNLDRDTFNGPLTISGALTASNGLTVNGALVTAGAGLTVNGNQTVSGTLTVTGAVTANAALTVTGALTASGGISGSLTVNGAVTVNGVLAVRGFTRISQQNTGSWAVFGSNMYSTGAVDTRLVDPAYSGASLWVSAEGGGTSEFRFYTMGAGQGNMREIATIGSGGLTVTGNETVSGGLTVTGDETVSGKLTVNGTALSELKGPVTVSGSLTVGSNSGMVEVGSLTRISQATSDGWACFGKNFYLTENSAWVLSDSSKPGVNFHMNAVGANNQEFRFARREAGSTVNVHLATIGTEGIVSNGKKVAAGYEFLYMIRGKVNSDGTVGAGSGFNASRQGTGLYQINFVPAFTSTPIAVATQYITTNSDTRDNAVIVGVDPNWIKVRVGDGNGNAANREFMFIAAGPRTT